MNEEKITQVFEELGITEAEYPAYTDPYTFAKQIKKFSLLQVDQICYTNNTNKLESLKIA